MTLLVLLACATASLDAATAPPAEELVSPDRHGSLVETSDTLLRVHAELQGLSPQRLAEVQQAAVVATSNCPYNRSAVQIPLVMDQVLAKHAEPELDGVKAALAQHVSVLDALGLADMGIPHMGEYLRFDMEGIFTGEQLAAHDDPVAGAMLLVVQIRDLVNAYPPATTARINGALETINAATLDEWELKGALLVYRNHLESTLAEDTLSPEATTDVEAVVHLISEFVQLRC